MTTCTSPSTDLAGGHLNSTAAESVGRATTLVFIGGAVGSLARYGVSVALPEQGGVPWSVILVNTAGAFLLGALVGWLGRAATERARRRRLLWGTGVLGGFTTYSALALATVDLVRVERVVPAILFPVGSVALGLVACCAGLLLGAAAATRDQSSWRD